MIKLAFRNLFRQKRRTLLTALTMVGGSVLATVGIGFNDGIYNDMIDLFTRTQLGHVQIHARGYRDRPSLEKTVSDPLRLGRTIEGLPRVTAWAPRVYSAGLATVGDKTTGSLIVGIDPARETRMTRFDRKIYEGRPLSSEPGREAVLGRGLARILKARRGDDLIVVTQGADGSLANEAYRIVGLLDSGNEDSDRMSFYIHWKDAQELLVLEDRVHEIAVTAARVTDTDRVLAAITAAVVTPGLDIEPWPVIAKSFYMAMKADQRGHAIMLLVIFAVVIVGVLNTTLMSVLERRREHGVLKALGTRPGRLFRMILVEVLILAVFSLAAGALLGGAADYALSRHGFRLSRPWSVGGMYFDTMRTELNARSLLLPAGLVLLAAFIASIGPAVAAARAKPARSLRFV